MGLATAAAISSMTAMITERSFMPMDQPAFLRTGETTMVSSSWAIGAPMKARPHLEP